MKKKEKLKSNYSKRPNKVCQDGQLEVMNNIHLFSVNPILPEALFSEEKQIGGSIKTYHAIRMGSYQTGGGCDYAVVWNKYDDEGFYINTFGHTYEY